MDVSVNWYARDVPNRLVAAAIEGLNQGAEHLLAKSNERVPVDTAALRNSGSVHEASAGDLTARVIYNAHYAVIVHEGTHMHFSTVKNSAARAKFLESAALDYRAEIAMVILAPIRRALLS